MFNACFKVNANKLFEVTPITYWLALGNRASVRSDFTFRVRFGVRQYGYG